MDENKYLNLSHDRGPSFGTNNTLILPPVEKCFYCFYKARTQDKHSPWERW